MVLTRYACAGNRANFAATMILRFSACFVGLICVYLSRAKRVHHDKDMHRIVVTGLIIFGTSQICFGVIEVRWLCAAGAVRCS